MCHVGIDYAGELIEDDERGGIGEGTRHRGPQLLVDYPLEFLGNRLSPSGLRFFLGRGDPRIVSNTRQDCVDRIVGETDLLEQCLQLLGIDSRHCSDGIDCIPADLGPGMAIDQFQRAILEFPGQRRSREAHLGQDAAKGIELFLQMTSPVVR